MPFYFDTSALVKLLITEAESAALSAWLEAQQPVAVTCDLTRTELQRAVKRRDPALLAQTRRLLDSFNVIALMPSHFDDAGRRDPIHLRSLDAIHIVAALELGDDLEGIVTYDDRMAEAAALHGIAVIAPC